MVLFRKSIVAIISIGALAFGLQAQAQKNWKDRAEYDLYDAITKDNNLQTRLQNLDKWKASYPTSDYADMRQKIYLVTYQGMNNNRAAFDMATEILKADPNDQTSLQEILGYIRALEPADPKVALTPQNKTDLETAEKAARYVLANADTIYGPAKKPQGVTDDVWAKTKPTMTNFAQFILGWAGAAEKDNAKAEAELTKALQMDPSNAQASYMLATTLLSQQKDHPEKMPTALFEYARAATYDGPNAIDAKARPNIDKFFGTAYNTYHGSPDGADKVKMLAKTEALPPAGFTIDSVVDIAKKKAAEDDAKALADPALALFETIKTALIADNGPAYFDASVKDAALPGGANGVMKFKGKLVTATPESKPKELTLAIGGDMPNVTLKLAEPLPGMMDPGGELSFSGAAKEFSKEPFMLTFAVEKDDIEGWTGKGPAGAARPGATKKAPAKKQ